MKTILACGVALGLAAFATPAAAQSASGNVNVTGTVGAKCTTATPISGTITLNELAQTDGTVDGAFTSQTGGLTRSFTVRCTAANVKIEVAATPLTIAGDAGTLNGYTGTVHYSSTMVADKASGGLASATYVTADVVAPTASDTLGDRLKNAADNVRVTVSNGYTTNATDLLKAGSYAGVVTLTVSPV